MEYKLSEKIIGVIVITIKKILSFFPLKVRYSFLNAKHFREKNHFTPLFIKFSLYNGGYYIHIYYFCTYYEKVVDIYFCAALTTGCRAK